MYRQVPTPDIRTKSNGKDAMISLEGERRMMMGSAGDFHEWTARGYRCCDIIPATCWCINVLSNIQHQAAKEARKAGEFRPTESEFNEF